MRASPLMFLGAVILTNVTVSIITLAFYMLVWIVLVYAGVNSFYLLILVVLFPITVLIINFTSMKVKKLFVRKNKSN
jgi:hypothetical protein